MAAGHRVAPHRNDVAAGLHQFEVEFGQVLERAVLVAGVADAVDVLGDSAAAGLAGQRKPALDVVAGHRRARGPLVVGVAEQIGRESCRARVSPYGWISEVPATTKK